jgi:hypothetical protein
MDLVLDNGELVRIECPTKAEDDVRDAIENAMKRRDWWSPAMADGCSATYLGQPMDRVNMGRVVGML